MNSSRKSSETPSPAHLAHDAGVDTRALTVPDDPIAAYLDLMRVVELLRPQEPERRERGRIAANGYKYKL